MGGANQVWLPNWVLGLITSPVVGCLISRWLIIISSVSEAEEQWRKERIANSGLRVFFRSTFTLLLDTRLTVEACFSCSV